LATGDLSLVGKEHTKLHVLLYESHGMQITDAFGSHFHVWRHRSS